MWRRVSYSRTVTTNWKNRIFAYLLDTNSGEGVALVPFICVPSGSRRSWLRWGATELFLEYTYLTPGISPCLPCVCPVLLAKQQAASSVCRRFRISVGMNDMPALGPENIVGNWLPLPGWKFNYECYLGCIFITANFSCVINLEILHHIPFQHDTDDPLKNE